MGMPAENSQQRREPPLRTVQRYFEQHKGQIVAALPKHLNADRMARLAMTSLSQNRALSECSAESIFGAVIMASQLGLEIGVAGQAYLVPYKGKATFVPGWQGLVDLVSRSGRATAWTGAVFEGDEFDWALGDSPFIRHKPCGENNPKLLRYVYAVGRVNGSQWPVIEVWPIDRVWKHRDHMNKVGTRHYSFENPEMYARKIPLLQVLKYMPKSIELSAAVDLANKTEHGGRATIDANFVVIELEDEDGSDGEGAGDAQGTTATDSLKAKVAQRQQRDAEPVSGATAEQDSSAPPNV
jgi:recombination protein RecT